MHISCMPQTQTGALEAQWFFKTGKLPNLSEQMLVDCSGSEFGCNGGFPGIAYVFIEIIEGIDTEKSYPYTGNVSMKCFKNGQTISLFTLSSNTRIFNTISI